MSLISFAISPDIVEEDGGLGRQRRAKKKTELAGGRLDSCFFLQHHHGQNKA